MNWLDFTALILAASGWVDVWTNGSIFADWRALMQDKADEDGATQITTGGDDEQDEGEPLPFLMRLADKIVPVWMADLLSCWFCFSHHTPYLLALVCVFPTLFVSTTWVVFLLKLPLYSLAATRAGTIINSLVPESARYDR